MRRTTTLVSSPLLGLVIAIAIAWNRRSRPCSGTRSGIESTRDTAARVEALCEQRQAPPEIHLDHREAAEGHVAARCLERDDHVLADLVRRVIDRVTTIDALLAFAGVVTDPASAW